MGNKDVINRYKILSGSMLKLIAIFSMLIDHTALTFRNDVAFLSESLFFVGEKSITLYYVMRLIGRLAFPIFCFLVSEGVINTRDLKKYATRLFVFAFVSEIPFDLMVSGKILSLSHQNVFFTLFMGVLMICVLESRYSEMKRFILMAFLLVIARFLYADYGIRGVLLILLIHVLRKKPAVQAVLAYPLLSGGIASFVSFGPINMYNGQRGFIKSKCMKYMFYVFYPFHMLLLFIIKICL